MFVVSLIVCFIYWEWSHC